MALLLNRADLERLLDVQSVIEAVQQGFADYSAGRSRCRCRTAVRGSDPPGVLLLMPCAMTESRVLGTKLVSVYPRNPTRGLPTIGALYVLSDFETGFPLAVMDAGFITGLRTAAASAVATRFMAREDARTLGIFGTGVQAEFHALAIPAVRSIERILVWGSAPEKGREFAARLQPRCQAQVAAGESLEQVAAADIVVTGTTATEPLFGADAIPCRPRQWGRLCTPRPRASWMPSWSPAVGWWSTPTRRPLPKPATCCWRSRRRIDRQHVAAELGEVVLGQKPGRERPDQVTLFKSCGVAFEDAVTASLAFERAGAAGAGQEFDFG